MRSSSFFYACMKNVPMVAEVPIGYEWSQKVSIQSGSKDLVSKSVLLLKAYLSSGIVSLCCTNSKK